MDGQSYTDKIVALALASGQEQKEAQYCANKTDGNKKWFLPALGQLNIMYNRVTDVQNGLTEVPHATQLTLSNYYWSSTEVNSLSAWFLRPSDGSTNNYFKETVRIFRCFAHF